MIDLNSLDNEYEPSAHELAFIQSFKSLFKNNPDEAVELAIDLFMSLMGLKQDSLRKLKPSKKNHVVIGAPKNQSVGSIVIFDQNINVNTIKAMLNNEFDGDFKYEEN